MFIYVVQKDEKTLQVWLCTSITVGPTLPLIHIGFGGGALTEVSVYMKQRSQSSCDKD